jgi:LytS/YehU family sensor histidine kinase
MVAVTCAFDFYRKYRERKLRAIELESRLVQAKLQALQMQLNPHFLFNSLHSISALMHKDIDAADRMISRLSELLRAALDNTERQEVPLRQELQFLRRYLEIEQIRFGSRLRVEINAAPETLDASVPNLILQPLVENAIRHGIEPHARPGRIRFGARRQADELTLEVHDNGGGLASPSPLDGVGLSNTRARLRSLYGEAHILEFCTPPEGGLLVRLILPFHSDSSSHEDSNLDRR